jgi:outer membrane protein TolC
VKDSEYARFELGEKTIDQLLQAQILWAGAARDYARAVINYNISLVTLGRAKGTLFKELWVAIQK